MPDINQSTTTFDEKSLRTEIVKTWGEHGAHADVFDHMLKLIARMTAAEEVIRTSRQASWNGPAYDRWTAHVRSTSLKVNPDVR